MKRWSDPVVLLVTVALLLPACAPKTAAPIVGAPRFPEFVRPPQATGAPAAVVADLDLAWNFLQAGNTGAAERTYARVLKQVPGSALALAGQGYVALARDEAERAVERFDQALAGSPTLVAALIGRGQALLRLDRTADALASFEAAQQADASANLTARIETLRFRVVERALARAREVAKRGDWDAARAAYEETLKASPESAVVYRELAAVERRAGLTVEADAHLARAVELDPTDRATFLLLAETREEVGDLDGAASAYEAALRLEPSSDIEARLALVRERADLSRLPAEFQALETKAEASRADLAAALAIRVPGLLARAPVRPTPVITDLRGHWARPWIMATVRAGVLDVYPNHTFQPASGVKRADVAQTVARVFDLLAAQGDRRVAAWQQASPQFTDLPDDHPAYRSAAQAIESGVLRATGGAFGPALPVSGRELIDAVAAIQQLAGPLAGRDRRSMP